MILISSLNFLSGTVVTVQTPIALPWWTLQSLSQLPAEWLDILHLRLAEGFHSPASQ